MMINVLIVILLQFLHSAISFITSEKYLPHPKAIQISSNKYNFVEHINKSEVNHGIINDILEHGKENNAFKKVDGNLCENKVLVKRILPHGIVPTGLEYDHKFNTIFKPLVRIHKRKSLKQLHDEIIANKYPTTFNEGYKGIYIILPESFKFKNVIKKNKDINADDVFNKLDDVNIDKGRFTLLKQIQNRIKGIKSKSKRLKAYDTVINVLNNILRTPQFEKSGEANDPLAPGKFMLPDEFEVNKEKKKKWIPHYPPWNYWTYKKTIHEDVCPGTQVKVGNMCIWTPPH